MIDLSTLPAPKVVESLSLDAIVQAMISDLVSRDPTFTALVESDPAYKILEVAAYRELLLRQRVNEAVQAVMLAYAAGSDLDQIGANFGVPRSGTVASLTVGSGSTGIVFTSSLAGSAGNAIALTVVEPSAPNSALTVTVVSQRIVISLATSSTSVPSSTAAQVAAAVNASSAASALVTAELVTNGSGFASAFAMTNLAGGIDESDTSFRKRIQLSLDGFSCAGPKGAYEYFSLNVPGVSDAIVQGPNDDALIDPGHVVVTIYGPGDSTATVAAVLAKLNADTIRPLNDVVTVQWATAVDFAIDATLKTYGGSDPTTVIATAQAAVQAYVVANKKIGRDITRAGIIAALYQSGIQNVTLTTPTADVVITAAQISNCTGITVTNGGTAE